MGDTIRGRRRDEPFNPFAPGASQQARKRTEDRRKSESADNAAQSKPVMSIAERRKRSLEALKNKQKESKTAIDDKEEVSAPITEGISLPQQPLQQKTESASPKLPDRRSQLEARTAASVETSKQVMEEKKNIETDNSPLVEKLTEDENELTPEKEDNKITVNGPDAVVLPENTSKGSSSNVFREIKTKVSKVQNKPKGRRRFDKKGGGRQAKVKKLDRRKYLEYKYLARDLLEHDSISEEHRSNVLGQVWAKGERISIDDALAFIDTKEAELILPKEIANAFRKMVDDFTTRR